MSKIVQLRGFLGKPFRLLPKTGLSLKKNVLNCTQYLTPKLS